MRIKKLRWIKVIMCLFLLLGSILLSPFVVAEDTNETIRNTGFTKGVSWKPVVPLKKVTFVNFDENGFLDDYAYLAAVPTTVFYNPEGNRLFSNPLLFYQDEYPVKEDKERTLNARQGLDYFMEDWMAYCNGQLDQMTLINVPQSKLKGNWNARNLTTIDSNNSYDIANKIALHEWSYSPNAVIAVIQDQFKQPNNITELSVSGQLPVHTVGHQQFNVEEPVIGTGGTYKYFNIDDTSYKYVIAELTWPNPVDYDLQLYDEKLGMVDNLARGYPEESVYGRVEVVGSYIHNYGKWGVSVTAVPVKSTDKQTNDTQNSSIETALKTLGKTLKNTGNVDITLYSGINLNIAKAPFGCRDVDFTLTWKGSAHLGFTLLDPIGTEISSSLSKEEVTSGVVINENSTASLHVDRLGECRENDTYSICIFSLDEIAQPVDFTLTYRWHQNFSKTEGECFASAANGAVLASALNAPLLYVSPSQIISETKDTLYQLGVKHIYLINIGHSLSKEVKDELIAVAPVTEYSETKDLYGLINEKTGNTKAVVFTTIDPWTYWYVAEEKPAGEYPGALFVGPAAFIAAHHGCSVIIVDLHPQLSQATVYPTDFWVKAAATRDEPTSGSMLLSGRQVYNFLEENNLGKLEPGKAANQIQETLITVADQYDIGAPWDRMFTGAALNGRFTFSPVDTAYWICRDVFYPAIIFINPAMQGEATLVNGSSSKAKLVLGRLRDPVGTTLVITKPSGEEQFAYPVLQTYTTYSYRFNEKAWKYWDFRYSTADGIIPYMTPSPDPIDDGATDKAGAYYPDMSETEVIPFYANKAGYDSVYSTNFAASVENLNRGVLIWVEECHGWYTDGGMIAMWDPDNPYVKEKNPWRAYEPILLYPGHLREFIRYMLYGLSGQNSSPLLSNGLIKFHLFPEIGSTENPDVASANPQKIFINRIAKKIGLPIDFWGGRGIVVYRDRVKHLLQTLIQHLPFVNIYDGDGKVTISPLSGRFTMKWMVGVDFDDSLENLHSCGLNTISCTPAYTYLHMTWLRHGMSYQIIDPWTTTDWAGVWNQMLIKRFAMGDTIGQAYELGMRACGPEFLVGQWWWDKWENVELFGDPSLRVFVPGTNYSSNNNWEKQETTPLFYNAQVSIDGHMPFGVTNYPKEKTSTTFWQQYLWLIVAFLVALLVIVIVVALAVYRSKTKK
jgi:hypothetical protein